MVNRALKKKIAYWAEKEENARDRSVPDGSDNNLFNRLRKYVHIRKRGHDCRTGLMESHQCEKY